MDIVAVCLSGVVAKVYDDCTENKIIEDGMLKECLHTLTCFLLGGSAFNDFTYTMFLYLVNVATHFSNSDAFSEMHEKTILYMFPIFFLISIPTIRSLSIVEIVFLCIAMAGSFTEGSVISEDVSLRKLLMRIIIVMLFGGLIVVGWYFEFMTHSLLKLSLFTMCYLLASCLFQVYELFFKNIHIGVNDQFIKNITLLKVIPKTE